MHRIGAGSRLRAVDALHRDDEHVDRRIATLAARQHGVVARRQLTALGLGRGAIARRLERGTLIVLHRGVYAVGHRAVGARGAAVAALLAVGSSAVVSHRSAAAIWRLAPDPPVPEVTVIGRRPRSRKALVIHQHDELDATDIRTVDGLPVTSPVRTLVDLAGVEAADALERALAEAQVLGLATPAAVRTALARARGRPGTRVLARLLDGGPAPTRSELERTMLRLVAAAGLPRPLVNTVIAGYEVDFAWAEQRLIVEADGWAAHGHRRAFERDRARDVDLQAAGWTVVRITWRQLTREPLRVAVRLADYTAARSPETPRAAASRVSGVLPQPVSAA